MTQARPPPLWVLLGRSDISGSPPIPWTQLPATAPHPAPGSGSRPGILGDCPQCLLRIAFRSPGAVPFDLFIVGNWLATLYLHPTQEEASVNLAQGLPRGGLVYPLSQEARR